MHTQTMHATGKIEKEGWVRQHTSHQESYLRPYLQRLQNIQRASYHRRADKVEQRMTPLFRVSWIISGKWLDISEPQEKPGFPLGLIQTERGPEISSYKQNAPGTRFALTLQHELCVFCLCFSVALIWLFPANTGAPHLSTPSLHVTLRGLSGALWLFKTSLPWADEVTIPVVYI